MQVVWTICVTGMTSYFYYTTCSVIIKTMVYIKILFDETEGVILISHEIMKRFAFGMSGGVLKLFMGLVVG